MTAIFSLDKFRGLLREWSMTLFDPDSGGFRCNLSIGANLMSTTDVIWIRYATNDLNPGAPDRDRIVRYLQNKQDPLTGMIAHDAGPAGQGHSPGHAFWQTVRALRILDAHLLHFPLHQQNQLNPSGLDAWFASFDWDLPSGKKPGNHHEVLGLVPAIVSLADSTLIETLFRNIDKQQNPQTGVWPGSHTNISRTFAYTALHLAMDRLPKYPEKIIDEILRLQNTNGLWDAPLPSFHTMDAAFLLVRLPQRINYRQSDALNALCKLSEAIQLEFRLEQEILLNNTHQTLAVTHTFGLLQEVFPDHYPSQPSYRFDWDRLELYKCEIYLQP
jgi:hypothetical protein